MLNVITVTVIAIIAFFLGVYIKPDFIYSLKNAFSKKQPTDTDKTQQALSPKIVAIGGGTGLSTLLRGIKLFTPNITAIVAVTDEGGSSGRIIKEWGILPPGDLRNCMVALAEDTNYMADIWNYRFDKGESLAGHSLGNLIVLASTEIFGDFGLAVESLNKLLAIKGNVLPMTEERVRLVGVTDGGKHVVGELAISENGKNLKKLWLDPQVEHVKPSVKKALKEADAIVLGPGSLLTSVMPSLLVKEISQLCQDTLSPIIYIANLMTQPQETEGMNIVSHVDWIAGCLGRVPDYIIVNSKVIPENIAENYRAIGAEPLYLTREEDEYLTGLGASIIYGDYCDIVDNKVIRHNTKALAGAIIKIISD